MAQISHVWIQVADLDACVKFYTEKLGLKQVVERSLEKARLVLLRSKHASSVILVSRPGGGEGAKIPSRIAIGWGVQNLEAFKTALEQKGVEFPSGILDLGFMKILNLRDPEGNVLQLTQVEKER